MLWKTYGVSFAKYWPFRGNSLYGLLLKDNIYPGNVYHNNDSSIKYFFVDHQNEKPKLSGNACYTCGHWYLGQEGSSFLCWNCETQGY